MIQNLCNVIDEFNLDTFYKVLIAEATQLPKFSHLDPDEDVLAIMNSLPVEFQAMIIPFLPEKFSLAEGKQLTNGNKIRATSLSFPVTPQDANIQNLLKTYDNKEVVAFVSRRSHAHLYGTSQQPLVFYFSELHATNPIGMKGFTISMQGEGYGDAKYFAGSEDNFPVIRRGLAFELAGSL